jgi:hypothetical protein
LINIKAQKEKNYETMSEIADQIGDMYLMELFWNMFEDLSAVKQKVYIERAKDILKEHK